MPDLVQIAPTRRASTFNFFIRVNWDTTTKLPPGFKIMTLIPNESIHYAPFFDVTLNDTDPVNALYEWDTFIPPDSTPMRVLYIKESDKSKYQKDLEDLGGVLALTINCPATTLMYDKLSRLGARRIDLEDTQASLGRAFDDRYLDLEQKLVASNKAEWATFRSEFAQGAQYRPRPFNGPPRPPLIDEVTKKFEPKFDAISTNIETLVTAMSRQQQEAAADRAANAAAIAAVATRTTDSESSSSSEEDRKRKKKKKKKKSSH